jgi:hypothetical protein
MIALLTKVRAIRMLKLIVWHSMIFLDLLYIGAFIAACTVIPDDGRVELISNVLTLAAGTHGGELLLSAGIRLWGKDEKGE